MICIDGKTSVICSNVTFTFVLVLSNNQQQFLIYSVWYSQRLTVNIKRICSLSFSVNKALPAQRCNSLLYTPCRESRLSITIPALFYGLTHQSNTLENQNVILLCWILSGIQEASLQYVKTRQAISQVSHRPRERQMVLRKALVMNTIQFQ